MLRSTVTALVLALGASCALAQGVAKPFLGNWKVEWQTDRQTYGAVMEITEAGGSWQTATSSRANPCLGRKVSIRHDSVAPNSLDVTLMFSEVMPDCKNATVKLRLDDQGTVSGKRSGHELQMKRE